jgi:16S rRNA (guanine1207-N2)-methyltransferase
MTMPGLFGWNKVDAGSALLIETLKGNQTRLSGRCADFGCGYGFLSQSILLEDSNDIKELRFIDHDARAVLLCLGNIGTLAKQKNVQPQPHWADLSRLQTIGETPFDHIIMNPPFHAQKQQQNALGLRFIENASKNLKNKGTLYMVANTHLPYERPLNALFSDVQILREQNGFKIIMAIK